MKPLHKYRGGGWMGYSFFPLWSVFQASWPFATLQLDNESVTFSLLFKKVELPYSEISSAKRILILPFIADGVKINHRAEGEPPILIFWNLNPFSNKKILNFFQSKGVKVA